MSEVKWNKRKIPAKQVGKVHFEKDGSRMCTSFTISPTTTKVEKKVTCANCLNAIRRLKIQVAALLENQND